MDDSRNNPSITLKELAEFIKKMYKRQGKSIKSVAGAEAVLKDIQSDLNIPVAVTYDRNNDEFDVVLKTIMRKKNFTSPDKVIKYEENDMTNQLPEGFMDAMKQLVPGAKGKPAKGNPAKKLNAEQVKISKQIDKKLKLIDNLVQKVRPLGGQINGLVRFSKLPLEKMTPKDLYRVLNDWYKSVEDELDYGDDSVVLSKKYGRSVENLHERMEELALKIKDYMYASGYDVPHGGAKFQYKWLNKVDFSAPKRTDAKWLKMNESVDLDEMKEGDRPVWLSVWVDNRILPDGVHDSKEAGMKFMVYGDGPDGHHLVKTTRKVLGKKRAGMFVPRSVGRHLDKQPFPYDDGPQYSVHKESVELDEAKSQGMFVVLEKGSKNKVIGQFKDKSKAVDMMKKNAGSKVIRIGKFATDDDKPVDIKVGDELSYTRVKLATKVKEEVEIDEAVKYQYVAIDRLGKVIGFASDERDAKDMATRGHTMDSPSKGKGVVGRNKAKVVKLKKPMSDKTGDMMINRDFDIGKYGDKTVYSIGLGEEEEPNKPDSAKAVDQSRDDKKKTRIAQLQLQIAKASETINKLNAQEK